MPSTDILTGAIDAGRGATQRTIDAGRDATQRTQDRVESIFRELLQTNLDQVEQAQRVLEDFIERSRKASERLVEVIDAEVRGQVEALSLATRADVRRLEDRIAELEKAAARPARSARSASPAATRTTSAAAPTKPAATRAKSAAAPAKKRAAKKAAPSARSGSDSES